MIVILLAVFVVLIGGVAGLWFVLDAGVEASSATSAPSYSPPAFPTPTYSPPSLPTYTPYSPPDPPSAPPTTYSPAFDPQPGDCVRNTGTYAHPHLYMSTCTPGHYRIIDRIDDTTNTRRCASTGYTYAVWFNSPAYVLCMRGL